MKNNSLLSNLLTLGLLFFALACNTSNTSNGDIEI